MIMKRTHISHMTHMNLHALSLKLTSIISGKIISRKMMSTLFHLGLKNIINSGSKSSDVKTLSSFWYLLDVRIRRENIATRQRITSTSSTGSLNENNDLWWLEISFSQKRKGMIILVLSLATFCLFPSQLATISTNNCMKRAFNFHCGF